MSNCDRNIYQDRIDVNDLFSLGQIDENISDIIVSYSNTNISRRTWYNNNYPFDLGNEIMLFSFIKYVLPILQISQRKFSYNFIPAYTRKTTHYKIMELITDEFPQANVIIMNGNGIEFWRKNSLNEIEKISTDYELNNNLSVKEKTKMLEPSYIIQKLIEDYSNFPTFVTGLTCVGMSVTLINQELGNFDNVVFMHNHFTSENLYQLCRFLFNYMSWSEENKRKIKNTKIHSYYKY